MAGGTIGRYTEYSFQVGDEYEAAECGDVL